jgi:hypothetical protein
MAYEYFEVDLAQPGAEPGYHIRDLSNHPVIEFINLLAVALMEVLGPFCWAALILLFFIAEFSPN